MPIDTNLISYFRYVCSDILGDLFVYLHIATNQFPRHVLLKTIKDHNKT